MAYGASISALAPALTIASELIRDALLQSVSSAVSDVAQAAGASAFYNNIAVLVNITCIRPATVSDTVVAACSAKAAVGLDQTGEKSTRPEER